MNRVKLSSGSKETDIDCMPNQGMIDFLESLYLSFLLAPIAWFCAIILQFCLMGHVSPNLVGATVTWSLASIFLLQEWPKWEPKTLHQIQMEETQVQAAIENAK